MDRHVQRWAERMEASGCWPEDGSGWIRQAMLSATRHQFAPDVVWVWSNQAWEAVNRAAEPERWACAVYGGPYDSTVTQLLDGLPSSSLSCGSVVADMLDSLKAEPGHRVLELGTGLGWNAALLATRSGAGRVTSVEVDSRLAAEALERLVAAGFDVAVHTGDGSAGWPAGAPYDRVIATYAVERVPWAWVQQTRPGGRIVTPWGRLGHVALTVADDGLSAHGWVQGLGMFMPSRGVDQGLELDEIRRNGRGETSSRFPRAVGPLADASLLFALRVLLPDIRITAHADAEEPLAWLHDGRSSWATIATTGPEDGSAVAFQGGPRRLADEIVVGWEQWTRVGKPSLYDFGMTRTEREQYIWSETEDGARCRWQPLSPPLYSGARPAA
ncbi:methyltransferase domain-containing protein [Streptomyces sp. NPDC023327]|uniref:methyltransferase domain-containing protein n=1 Tax=Streptomyces sp. NPDC023327 TaxID=3157088 RepID=UPI003410C77E